MRTRTESGDALRAGGPPLHGTPQVAHMGWARGSARDPDCDVSRSQPLKRLTKKTGGPEGPPVCYLCFCCLLPEERD